MTILQSFIVIPNKIKYISKEYRDYTRYSLRVTAVCPELSLLMAEDLTNPWERGWDANNKQDKRKEDGTEKINNNISSKQLAEKTKTLLWILSSIPIIVSVCEAAEEDLVYGRRCRWGMAIRICGSSLQGPRMHDLPFTVT